MRKVRITVCSTKLHSGGMLPNTGPSAKLQSTTMVTFTKLLAIRIVANRRSGMPSRRLMAGPRGVSSSSSHCAGVREKKAISLPDTNPDTTRHISATTSATVCPALNTGIEHNTEGKRSAGSMAGKGSISKTFQVG